MVLESTLASFVRIVDALRKVNLKNRIDRVKVDCAVQTLRQIFFFPSELIAVLEDLEAGRLVEAEVVEYFLEDFRMVPPHIQVALSYIDIERFEDVGVLRIDDMQLMSQVRYGKLDIRRDIREFFESVGRDGSAIKNNTAKNASRILGQIARFNASVKLLEEKLLSEERNYKHVVAPNRVSRTRIKKKLT